MRPLLGPLPPEIIMPAFCLYRYILFPFLALTWRHMRSCTVAALPHPLPTSSQGILPGNRNHICTHPCGKVLWLPPIPQPPYLHALCLTLPAVTHCLASTTQLQTDSTFLTVAAPLLRDVIPSGLQLIWAARLPCALPSEGSTVCLCLQSAHSSPDHASIPVGHCKVVS